MMSLENNSKIVMTREGLFEKLKNSNDWYLRIVHIDCL